MRRLAWAVLLLAVAGGAAAPEKRQPAKGDPLQPVQRLAAAFNEHDTEAMMAHVTDEVEWLSISGEGCATETSGKQALREGMTGYFEALPSAASAIEGSLVSGSYVAVRERASWTADGKQKSQAALAVYQVEDGKVRRVWYFPAGE